MLCLLHSANILGLWAHLDQAVLCSLPTLDAVAWEGEGMLETTSPYIHAGIKISYHQMRDGTSLYCEMETIRANMCDGTNIAFHTMLVSHSTIV